MTEIKATFIFGVIALICITLLIGQCSYRLTVCQKEAINAKMPASEIKELCR